MTRPGEAEAVEAASRTMYSWPLEELHADDSGAAVSTARAMVAAAYPVIFAEGVKAGREQAAQEIEALAPYNCELNYDGTERLDVAAWVEGIHNAADCARGMS